MTSFKCTIQQVGALYPGLMIGLLWPVSAPSLSRPNLFASFEILSPSTTRVKQQPKIRSQLVIVLYTVTKLTLLMTLVWAAK
jgi:hypothetical protein